MTLQDLKKLPVYQTSEIAKAANNQRSVLIINDYLRLFYNGFYGKVTEEDTAANRLDLEAGKGIVVAKYSRFDPLTEDIYFIAYFDKDKPETDKDSHHITICYESELLTFTKRT